MKNPKLFFECSCLNEILVIEKWDDESEELSLAMYKLQNYPNYLPFLKRLRLSLRILFKGEMYHDNILLEKEKVLELKNWLNKSYENKAT